MFRDRDLGDRADDEQNASEVITGSPGRPRARKCRAAAVRRGYSEEITERAVTSAVVMTTARIWAAS